MMSSGSSIRARQMTGSNVAAMIKVQSRPTIEHNAQGGWQLVFSVGETFDYSTPFRGMLANIANVLSQEVPTSMELPTYEDFRALIGKVDAAIVATPTIYHYDVASTLLRAGIHVLVEKPLAATPDQAGRLVQIAYRHALVLHDGHVEADTNPTRNAPAPSISPAAIALWAAENLFDFGTTDELWDRQ